MGDREMIDGMFGIKLVWPGYFGDELAYERVGFPRGYDERLDIPIGSKMLIYVTEVQRIMALSIVTGTWEEGERKYAPSGQFPICLPVETPIKSQIGLTKDEIKRMIPRFQTYRGLSFFPISEAEFIELEQALKTNG